MAVSQAYRDWVWKLRETGASIRQIAAITGLSRSAVTRILESGREVLPGSGPIGRCPRCRRLVRLPCLACYLETAPPHKRRAWKTRFSKMEKQAMDLVKELVELKKAIQDAREDGRITPLEAVRIAKEAADVLQIVGVLIFGVADAKAKEIEAA